MFAHEKQVISVIPYFGFVSFLANNALQLCVAAKESGKDLLVSNRAIPHALAD
jgi:hypothetical protein